MHQPVQLSLLDIVYAVTVGSCRDLACDTLFDTHALPLLRKEAAATE